MNINKQGLRWIEYKQIAIESFNKNPKVVVISELAIPTKHSGYFALLPFNLDLEAHIERYPLTDYMFVDYHGHIKSINREGTLGSKFDIERLIHVLELIASGFSDDKDSIGESDYVPIFAQRIRKYFKDYLCYLDYAIQTGIVVCDRQYIVGEKPRSYKYAYEYDNVPLKRYLYRSIQEGYEQVKPVDEEVYNKATDDFERNSLLDKTHLNHWYYQQKLKLDISIAEKYALWRLKDKLNSGIQSWEDSKTWDSDKKRYKKKNPNAQYKAIVQKLNEIEIHHYKAKIDTNVHRLSSVLTNMQKEFRDFLTYDGQQLISVDIKNSQPYLICLILNKEFWKEDSTLPININTLPENIQALFNTPPTVLLNIRSFSESVNEVDFRDYIRVVATGIMYEEIVKRAIRINRNSKLNRKKAKTSLLAYLYAPNKEVSNEGRRIHMVERVFNQMFPKVSELFYLIKDSSNNADLDNQHSRFARMLQSIESEIVLNRCCLRMWAEANHQIPIFTIHDSIVTTVEHQDYVRRVMEEVMTECIGIKPTLAIEAWHISNRYNVKCLPVCL